MQEVEFLKMILFFIQQRDQDLAFEKESYLKGSRLIPTYLLPTFHLCVCTHLQSILTKSHLHAGADARGARPAARRGPAVHPRGHVHIPGSVLTQEVGACCSLNLDVAFCALMWPSPCVTLACAGPGETTSMWMDGTWLRSPCC